MGDDEGCLVGSIEGRVIGCRVGLLVGCPVGLSTVIVTVIVFIFSDVDVDTAFLKSIGIPPLSPRPLSTLLPPIMSAAADVPVVVVVNKRLCVPVVGLLRLSCEAAAGTPYSMMPK